MFEVQLLKSSKDLHFYIFTVFKGFKGSGSWSSHFAFLCLTRLPFAFTKINAPSFRIVFGYKIVKNRLVFNGQIFNFQPTVFNFSKKFGNNHCFQTEKLASDTTMTRRRGRGGSVKKG